MGGCNIALEKRGESLEIFPYFCYWDSKQFEFPEHLSTWSFTHSTKALGTHLGSVSFSDRYEPRGLQRLGDLIIASLSWKDRQPEAETVCILNSCSHVGGPSNTRLIIFNSAFLFLSPYTFHLSWCTVITIYEISYNMNSKSIWNTAMWFWSACLLFLLASANTPGEIQNVQLESLFKLFF